MQFIEDGGYGNKFLCNLGGEIKQWNRFGGRSAIFGVSDSAVFFPPEGNVQYLPVVCSTTISPQYP